MLNVYVGMHIDVTWKFSSLVLFSFRFARTASATVKLEALRPPTTVVRSFCLVELGGSTDDKFDACAQLAFQPS